MTMPGNHPISVSEFRHNPDTQTHQHMNPSTTIELPTKLLALAAPADRPALHCALIDDEHRAIIITNGRGLASIPIPGTAAIQRGKITPELWKKAKVKGGKYHLDYAAGLLNGQPIEECPVGEYPNYRAVLPDYNPVYRVAISSEIIRQLADSIGEDTLIFEFPKEVGGVIVRHGNEGKTGVVMPYRNNESADGLLVAGEVATSTDDGEVASLREKVAALQARLESASNAAAHTAPAAPPTPPAKPAKPAVASATAPPVLTYNKERNGIELRFNGKPDEATRISLKSMGFRWLPGQPGQPWAVRHNAAALAFAESLAAGSECHSIRPQVPFGL